MRKMKLIATLVFVGTTVVCNAQEVSQLAEPSIFEGPNLALGIVAVVLLIAIMSIVGILNKLTNNPDYFLKLKNLKSSSQAKNAGLFIGFISLASGLQAQDSVSEVVAETAKYPELLRDPNTVMLLGLNLLLAGVFVYVMRLLLRTIAMLMPEQEKAKAVVAEKTAEQKIFNALVDMVPVDQEDEIMMDHEYDGIRELDNNLPPWWVWMFNLSIVFSVVYMVYYHVLPYGETQAEEYEMAVVEAEIAKQAYLAQAKDLVDENTVVMLSGASDLSAGKGIYIANCQVCHAADGGGGVGPNFTDQYWLHGGSINDVFATIKHGVPSKGMISWEAQLRPVEIAQVASYIMTMVGTTPLEAKEPQGELWEAAGSESAPTEEGASDKAS